MKYKMANEELMKLRFVRAATINSMVIFRLITEDQAKASLKGNLIEGDDRTYIDDSSLLGKTWDELRNAVFGIGD